MHALRPFAGKVPIYGPTGLFLVEFPTREDFEVMYSARVRAKNIPRYWDMLKARDAGATLSDAGKPHGITRERVRQIEAQFMLIMHEWVKDKKSA